MAVALLASATVYTSSAFAQSAAPAKDAAAKDAADEGGPEIEVYGTLLPYVESVGTTGATPAGSASRAYQVQSANITGLNHERRFRMTSGTSHLGFRGFLPIAGDDLKLVWQLESPAPIDGEGPSNWAARNSHVGFSGGWGTLVYGNWDTPMRWVTVTSVNPIKGGYTGDMTALIGSPGHQVSAWNSDQALTALFEIPPNRAGFFRHESNSIQYWSPTLLGFSARLMFAANEHRTAGIPNPTPGAPATEPGLNPYLLSGYVGYDNDWLRLRYAYEVHNDYFGTANMAGAGPATNSPSSSDTGHLALASVKINAGSDYQTRIVATGDLLSYHTDVSAAGIGTTNEFSRPAFYGLVQQSFGANHIWLAYGQSGEGECHVTGPGFENTCTTTGLGAKYVTLGLMHEFTQAAAIYALGYSLMNDYSARYTPFPLLAARPRTTAATESLPNIGDMAPGSDVLGIGVGFVYSFSVKILGGGKEAPAGGTGKATAPVEEIPAVNAAAEATPPPAQEATAPEGAAPVGTEASVGAEGSLGAGDPVGTGEPAPASP